MENKTDVIIIGAGISGLTAARILKASGLKIKLIEASDGIGGRVRTDEVEGFKLDRGFQVFLTAYPEAKGLLDYRKLSLRSFRPGASILRKNSIREIGDPIREPLMLFPTLFSPIGTLKDKLLLLKLKIRLATTSLEAIFEKEETTTHLLLKEIGFSKKMVEEFLRPFFAGIFLEKNLTTSSRMFEFVFKMFGEGVAAVPADGMQMIANQLAEHLTDNDISLNEKVLKIDGNKVFTDSGKTYEAEQIIIATTENNLPEPFDKKDLSFKSAVSMYFGVAKQKTNRRLIALNSNRNQLINNIAFMDSISENYAPRDRSLIGISVIENQGLNQVELVDKVIAELSKWYPKIQDIKHLRTYVIPYALPSDEHVKNEVRPTELRREGNCFICGDYLLNGSINAAMKSGRLAAEALIANLVK